MELKSINEKLDKNFESIINTVDGIDITSVKTEGVTIKIGDNFFELKPTNNGNFSSFEDIIREEMLQKISSQMKQVKEIVKAKRLEASSMIDTFMEEFNRKEKLLRDTISKSAPMPEINWEHAKKGLSVIKGVDRGSLIWLARRKYNPKFVDMKPIETLYVKKMITNIIIAINTTDNKVLRVSTHYMGNLDYFSHYHQNNPDCWGNWKYPSRWDKIEDIISIADDAEAVLENINTMSIAKRNPYLLPRLDTLLKHVSLKKMEGPIKVQASDVREGFNEVNEDVWGN